MEVQRFYGTGKRKTAIARVWLKMPGEGRIIVNKRDFRKLFSSRDFTAHSASAV